MLEWKTAGESHGQALVALVEHAPAGVSERPTSLARATTRLAVPGMTSRLTKYPPVGEFHVATS